MATPGSERGWQDQVRWRLQQGPVLQVRGYAQQAKVRGPYGVHTIKELTRYVNVNGTGESAQPSGGSTWKYLPRDQR